MSPLLLISSPTLQCLFGTEFLGWWFCWQWKHKHKNLWGQNLPIKSSTGLFEHSSTFKTQANVAAAVRQSGILFPILLWRRTRTACDKKLIEFCCLLLTVVTLNSYLGNNKNGARRLEYWGKSRIRAMFFTCLYYKYVDLHKTSYFVEMSLWGDQHRSSNLEQEEIYGGFKK